MKNDREWGMDLLQQWAKKEVKEGRVREAHSGLLMAMRELLEEFRTEHDIPGVRYFEAYLDDKHTRQHFTTFFVYPDDNQRPKTTQIVEVNRLEFLARQGKLHPPLVEKKPAVYVDDDDF